MTTHYHDREDRKYLKDLAKLAPKEFEAWLNLDNIVRSDEGKIPRKYRELIALAVAHVTQCAYCIDAHVRGAKKAGATKEEAAEAILIAAALRAGAAGAHAGLTLRLWDEG